MPETKFSDAFETYFAATTIPKLQKLQGDSAAIEQFFNMMAKSLEDAMERQK